MPEPAHPSLLGIPPELRSRIWEYLYLADYEEGEPRNVNAFLSLFTSLYGLTMPSLAYRDLSLIYVNHQLYGEVSSVVYSNCSFYIFVHGTITQGDDDDDDDDSWFIGRPETVRWWRYVRDVSITICMPSEFSGSYDRLLLVERTGRLVDQCLHRATMLKKLSIEFVGPSWGPSNKYPKWRPLAAEKLMSLRVEGEVSVRLEFGYEDKTGICDELARTVGGQTIPAIEQKIRPLCDAWCQYKQRQDEETFEDVKRAYALGGSIRQCSPCSSPFTSRAPSSPFPIVPTQASLPAAPSHTFWSTIELFTLLQMPHGTEAQAEIQLTKRASLLGIPAEVRFKILDQLFGQPYDRRRPP